MTGTAWLRSTHRRCFNCCIWYAFGKPGELKADREYSSYTDCGRDHRDEYSSYTDCGRDRRGEQILDCVEEHPEPLLVGNQSDSYRLDARFGCYECSKVCWSWNVTRSFVSCSGLACAECGLLRAFVRESWREPFKGQAVDPKRVRPTQVGEFLRKNVSRPLPALSEGEIPALMTAMRQPGVGCGIPRYMKDHAPTVLCAFGSRRAWRVRTSATPRRRTSSRSRWRSRAALPT